MKRSRSLTTTLSLAFAGTTLAVFALLGNVEYITLKNQVQSQDDLDIVLAARHVRRLAQELQNTAEIRQHADRLTSLVLGNQALSLLVEDRNKQRLIDYDTAQISIHNDMHPPPIAPIPATARITDVAITQWETIQDVPIRGVATEAALRDGNVITILVARNMGDRGQFLSRYRNKMYAFGTMGVLLSFLLSYALIRASLRSLRDIAGSTGRVTIDRLGKRIDVANVPQELEVLVSSLNAMLARLDDGFIRLSRFTADLAHDMRTPLSNMRGATEVALGRPRSKDEYQMLLASNLEECDRLSRMIKNVLFLARAEHPQFRKNMREFNVQDELTRIAEYFEGLAEEAGITVRTIGSRLLLMADVELFQRAVSNLLANALRYTPRAGEITLLSEGTDSGVRIIIANQGTPIDAAHLDKIFDRFYRADPSRSNPAGSTGLGLAIVRSIMELHGGSVHVESDLSSTRFILDFPRS